MVGGVNVIEIGVVLYELIVVYVVVLRVVGVIRT
jgi:hypothetical protein